MKPVSNMRLICAGALFALWIGLNAQLQVDALRSDLERPTRTQRWAVTIERNIGLFEYWLEGELHQLVSVTQNALGAVSRFFRNDEFLDSLEDFEKEGK